VKAEIDLPDEELRRIQALAAIYGIPPSQVIRRACNAYTASQPDLSSAQTELRQEISTGITEGMQVRLLGPEGHELHGATGYADRVMDAAWLWEHQPLTMLGDPFAWPDGQILVSLDKRPRGGPRNTLWTPYVTVSPDDVEPVIRAGTQPR
jgi:hypothetical protein